jgi:hypothetical protein
MGGQLWIYPGSPQKIESEEILREEFVPKIQRDVGVGGTWSCNEVVLEGTHGALGGVSTMDVGRRQLEINVRGVQKLLQRFCGFIVEALQ